jgi:hypothetical protein
VSLSYIVIDEIHLVSLSYIVIDEIHLVSLSYIVIDDYLACHASAPNRANACVTSLFFFFSDLNARQTQLLHHLTSPPSNRHDSLYI